MYAADILHAATESGDPRVNIGEQTTKQGFGADTAVWGSGTAFVSIPNPPTDAGAAQALVDVEGNSARVVAARDNRFTAAAGPLTFGDAAIVSSSDACARLVAALALFEIKSTDMSIELAGQDGELRITKGGTTLVLTSTGATLSFSPVPGPPVASIALSSTGVAITAAAVTVNGLALIVP